MNHLAHALLADAGGAEFALGSALGDFRHGQPDPAWPQARQAGLRFHRGIDRYTDNHPQVVAARNTFQPPLRRYAGILLDVWFDHLLVCDWARYCDEPAAVFCRRWLALLDAHAAELPPQLGGFIDWMHGHGLPLAYGDPATIADVLQGLSARLSRPSPIATALPELQRRAAILQPHFDAFFPELLQHARKARTTLLDSSSPKWPS
ncbi:MAG TPA: ACP phosphodiesterase [Rhodanobacteraceae bacterium]|jgi:acyl carrier protein phosphodiesterase|nr:ACP phosphodiesterase [Rhodanobacteraceae bacterium]